jgi:hypothetical protein
MYAECASKNSGADVNSLFRFVRALWVSGVCSEASFIRDSIFMITLV